MSKHDLVLCLDNDGKQASTREFHRVATRVASALDAPLFFYHGGQDLAHTIWKRESMRSLVIIGHGSPTWIGLPGRRGIHRWRTDPDTTSAIYVGRLLRERTCQYIGLATCMSGASPRWYRSRFFGEHFAPWGPASHADGGSLSIAGQLAKHSNAVVRAHTTAGHCTFNPCIREFQPGSTVGRSLKPPTVSRGTWNKAAQGMAAESLIIGLD